MKKDYSDNFYVKQLQQFVGQTVTGIACDPVSSWSEDQPFFGLIFGKKVLWFLMDDEGNGPGSFEIDNLR